MKKIVICIQLLAIFIIVPAYGMEIVGKYITKPEIEYGFKKPYDERTKDFIKQFTIEMVITKSEIIIKSNAIPNILKMTYTVEGKYILGRYVVKGIERFVPFYIKDEDTIYGYVSIFFKQKTL